MSDITFYAGEGFNTYATTGSGLGFYGTNFGFSVSVNEHQDTTFITDSTGTSAGPQVDNNKYVNESGVSVNGAGAIHLLQLPNYLSTLNIRFTSDAEVRTQNAVLYGHARGNRTTPADNLSFYAAEIIHPDESQTLSGSGTPAWVKLEGDVSTLALSNSPGTSGLSPQGDNTEDTRHDYYVALSVSPETAGSKEFALTVELEFV